MNNEEEIIQKIKEFLEKHQKLDIDSCSRITRLIAKEYEDLELYGDTLPQEQEDELSPLDDIPPTPPKNIAVPTTSKIHQQGIKDALK